MKNENGECPFAPGSGNIVAATDGRGPGPAIPPTTAQRYLFHEYFHADNGTGLGASHQTGWTALVAKLIQQQGEFGTIQR